MEWVFVVHKALYSISTAVWSFDLFFRNEDPDPDHLLSTVLTLLGMYWSCVCQICGMFSWDCNKLWKVAFCVLINLLTWSRLDAYTVPHNNSYHLVIMSCSHEVMYQALSVLHCKGWKAGCGPGNKASCLLVYLCLSGHSQEHCLDAVLQTASTHSSACATLLLPLMRSESGLLIV